MIKDLKMELLNSEQAKAIYGGGTPCDSIVCSCDAPDEIDKPCATGNTPHPQPIPCQLQNQLSKWSGILSVGRSESSYNIM